VFQRDIPDELDLPGAAEMLCIPVRIHPGQETHRLNDYQITSLAVWKLAKEAELFEKQIHESMSARQTLTPARHYHFYDNLFEFELPDPDPAPGLHYYHFKNCESTTLHNSYASESFDYGGSLTTNDSRFKDDYIFDIGGSLTMDNFRIEADFIIDIEGSLTTDNPGFEVDCILDIGGSLTTDDSRFEVCWQNQISSVRSDAVGTE
jgi:hypothetical protein